MAENKYYKRSLFTLLLVACNVIFLLVPFTNPFVIKVNIKPSKCWILLNFFSIKLYPCVLWWAKSNECFVSCCHACSINLVANIFDDDFSLDLKFFWFQIILIEPHFWIKWILNKTLNSFIFIGLMMRMKSDSTVQLTTKTKIAYMRVLVWNCNLNR